jgi:hypothetical protein
MTFQNCFLLFKLNSDFGQIGNLPMQTLINKTQIPYFSFQIFLFFGDFCKTSAADTHFPLDFCIFFLDFPVFSFEPVIFVLNTPYFRLALYYPAFRIGYLLFYICYSSFLSCYLSRGCGAAPPELGQIVFSSL